MALNGIGSGSPLERFQALRDSAKKKIDGADSQANLAELIKRKQTELGTEIRGGAASSRTGIAAKPAAERILPMLGASGQKSGAAAGNAVPGILAGPTGYGRSGGLQKQDSRPILGRHVDFMA